MKISMQKQVSAVMTLGVAVLVTGCGGGGQSTPAVPAAAKANSAAVKTAKAKLTIKIPLETAALASKSGSRKPQYVSSHTTELAIRAGTTGPSGTVGSAAWQIFDVSSTAPVSPNVSCTTDTTSLVRTCQIAVTAPAVQGVDDEFQIGATDSTTVATDTIPTGNFLSTGDTTETVSVGAANAVSVSLTSVIGYLAVANPSANPSYSVWAAPGASANVVVGITASDLDHGQIFGQPSAFANPLTFADTLTTSPFTYPSANLAANPPNYGLPPSETVNVPIQATIAYLAPTTGSTAAATVTVSTITPDYLPPPAVPPTATFALDPMVVSVAGTPVGSLSNLVAGTPVVVTVNESGATSFTVADNADAQAVLTLNPPAQITATNGSATFTVSPRSATTTGAPAITITDANGTVATLAVIISAAAAVPASNI
jgi:hypothetical protein